MRSKPVRASGSGRRRARPTSAQRSSVAAAHPTTSAQTYWRPVSIVLAGTLTYLTSLRNPFLFDDVASVVQNQTIRHLWSGWPPSETAVAGRPLVNFSFALNYWFGGLTVTSYHVVNIVLHVVVALLIYAIVRRTIVRANALVNVGAENVAFAAALLWTVHPLGSEVVDYLTQRTESLMAVCFLACLYASIRALDSRRSRLWMGAAIAFCLAGIASKETIVVAPLAVVLYDRVFAFPSIREAVRQRWPLYVGLALTWAPLAALVIYHGQSVSAGFATARVSSWTYLLNQTRMLARYASLVVWPHGLVLYYGWPQPLTLGDIWPYGLFVVVLLGAALVTLIRRPTIGFPVVLAFLLLAPTSSLLPIATEVGAERRMYLPLAALITAVVVSVAAWYDRRLASRGADTGGRGLFFAAAAALAVVLAVTTVLRTREYSSGLVMARTVLDRWPGANAQAVLGKELAVAGQHQEAIEHLRLATAGYPAARYMLGSELVQVGSMDEATNELQQFVRDEPNSLTTRTAYLLLARAFASKQHWADATRNLQVVLNREPTNPEANGLLAEVLVSQQKFQESIPHYQVFLTVHPDDGSA